MLSLRMILPTFVVRGSFSILKAGPSASFKCATSSNLSSASTHIERNLYILNIFPFLPTRSCKKNAFPPSSRRIAAEIIKKNGSKIINPTDENTISPIRFINSYALLFSAEAISLTSASSVFILSIYSFSII